MGKGRFAHPERSWEAALPPTYPETPCTVGYSLPTPNAPAMWAPGKWKSHWPVAWLDRAFVYAPSPLPWNRPCQLPSPLVPEPTDPPAFPAKESDPAVSRAEFSVTRQPASDLSD